MHFTVPGSSPATTSACISSQGNARNGPPCDGVWRPADVHVYIARDTHAYRLHPGWGKYNEFIIDGRVWDAALPHAIDAFMSGKRMSEAVHQAFLGKYGLRADEIPLLTMQPDYERPFVVGPRWGSHGDPTQTPQSAPASSH